MAVLDFGFAAYALIASPSLTCGTYALPAFRYAPTPVVACGSALSATATSDSIGSVDTVKVAVSYTLGLIAIPGLMPNRITITKNVYMPVR